MVHVDTEGQS